MRDTFARTLVKVAEEVPGVFLIASDISPVGSMEDFRDKFPNRFYNVGVAESTMISICAGLALRGGNPFAYTVANFALYRPFEQVRSAISYQDLPVTVVGIGAGVSYGTLGGTHHAQEDIAILSGVPNMSIIAPCDPAETESATWECARSEGPVYLRLGRSGEPDLTHSAPESFEFGKVRLIKKGNDTCIMSYGPIMKRAIEIADELESGYGESVAVASVHTLKPLDNRGIIDILNRFNNVIVFEEHSHFGGLGVQVKEIAWDQKSKCSIHTFSLKDKFFHKFGTTEDMWDVHDLTVANVVSKTHQK